MNALRILYFTLTFTSFLSLNTKAQQPNLSGAWQGRLLQNYKFLSYDMSLDLKQVKDSIFGTAKYIIGNNTATFVVFKIKGKIDGAKITMLDLEVTDEKTIGEPRYWCNKVFDGRIIFRNDSIILAGKWQNEDERRFYKNKLVIHPGSICYPGTFEVGRPLKPIIPETPITIVPAAKTREASPTSKVKTQDTNFLNRENMIEKIIPTSSNSIKITFTDDSVVDGDIITVYFNKKLILYRHTLNDKPTQITLNLLPNKDNEIVMFSDSEGKIPPNTALMSYSDGIQTKGVLIKSDTKQSGTIIFRQKQNN